jgi:LPXTG-motif cell wall-anchored protein
MRRFAPLIALLAAATLTGALLPGSNALSAPVTPSPGSTQGPAVAPIPNYINTCDGITALLTNGSVKGTYVLVFRTVGPFSSAGEVTLEPFETATPIKVPGTVGQSLSVSWQLKGPELDTTGFVSWVRPANCPATKPLFEDTYTSTCTGVTTKITNIGKSKASFVLHRIQTGIDGVRGVPGQVNIELNPGQSRTAVVPSESGRGFSLSWQPTSEQDIRDDFTAWVRPANCGGTGPTPTTGSTGSPAPSATATAGSNLKPAYENTCEGIETTVRNDGNTRDIVSLIRRQAGIDATDGVPGQQHIVLEPGQSHKATVGPVDGRGFSLQWQSDSILPPGDNFFTWDKPDSCNGDGGLPTTGVKILDIVLVGLVLALAGVIILLVVRRRRSNGGISA